MDVIFEKPLVKSPFPGQESFRGIIGCKEWGRAILNMIDEVAQRGGIPD